MPRNAGRFGGVGGPQPRIFADAWRSSRRLRHPWGRSATGGKWSVRAPRTTPGPLRPCRWQTRSVAKSRYGCVAVGGLPCARVVVLVIALGLPEVGRGAHGGGHVVPPLAEALDERFGVALLLFVDVEDRGEVLVSDVRALSVLLRGVVDQGGGGQVCVLVLQLTVQRCGNVCLYIASRLAIASILNITYRLESTRSFDKRLLRKCCYHLDCSFYKKSKAFPRLL